MQDIDELVSNLPKVEQTILKTLRNLILDADPRIQERQSYGVPYYFRKRRIFFLWPASALPSGGAKKTSKVTMGFCYGNLLSNEQNLLQGENRKQVFTIPFASITQINERVLVEIINEAILVDEKFF